MKSDSDKYQLRPRAMRGRPESRSRRQPAPLSKYRRKTANARERSRMREINQAFEALRRAVPAPGGAPAAATCEKLTKITTLRLAMRYIGALSSALREPSPPPSPPSPPPLSPPSGSWPSFCSELSELSPEFAHEAPSSDFAEDSLTPFETFLAEFNYIERGFL